jgi:gliding motility-associated-like protein
MPNPGPGLLLTTYTLTVTNAAGCTATDQATATVYPPAVAATGPAVAVCAGQAAILAAGSTPVPGTTYHWSPATGLSNPTVLSPTLTLTTPGSYTYTLTAAVAPAGGVACTSTATVAVLVAAAPVAQAAPGGAVSFCSGETRQLGGGPAVPGVAYQWRPTTGLAAPTAASTAITLVNTTAAPLTTVYTLVATSAAGCADSSQVAVTVSPAVVVDAGPDAVLCSGLSTTLGTSAQPGYTYSWSPATGLNDASAARPVLTVTNTTAAPRLVTYYLTATPGGGAAACPGRDSLTVTINPAPVAAITGPVVVCDLRQPQAYAVATPLAGANYQWSATGGSVVAGQGTATATVQFVAGAGGYAVSVTPNSMLGCASAPTTVSVGLDAARVQLAVASVDAASNTSLTLGFAAAGQGPVQVLRRVAGQGSFAAVGTVPATATTFTDTSVNAAASSYDYRLDLTDACGTTLSSSPAQTVRLQATNAGTTGTGGRDQGATALSWNAYGGFPVRAYRIYRRLDGGAVALLDSVPGTVLQKTIPAAGAGGYTGAGFSQEFRVVAVSAATPALLASSNTAGVSFANAVRTYNVITPNGDKLNDVLVVDNIGLYPGNSLRIFNRWGREVYATTNYQNTWGPAADVAPGVYYYLLTLPSAGTTLKGWVEVLK